MGGTRPSSDSELRGILGNFADTFNLQCTLQPDVEAGCDQDGLGEVVEAELQPVPGDGEADEGAEDDCGLEHEAAGDGAQHHARLGEPRHEVQQARPPAEDGDEDDDKGRDPGLFSFDINKPTSIHITVRTVLPGHVLQLRPGPGPQHGGLGCHLAAIFNEQHAG